MSKPRIVLIDNNQNFIDLFLCQPETDDFDLVPFTDAADAIEWLKNQTADLVLSDIEMPGMKGNELLSRVQDMHPDVPVILITAYGSSEHAIRAIKQGAFHYFEKPIDDKIDLFWTTVKEAIDKRRRMLEIEMLQRQRTLQEVSQSAIVGESEGMAGVLESIRNVADLDVTVLVTGETGTGKELVARAIHDMSHRRDNGFFAVNCSALAPTLLETELFGHEKGSFTGAVARKKGLFEVADNATLFLDEISNAPLDLQAKLLRVLESREFTRVGGTGAIASDFRIIAATNTDLEAEVQNGRFRQDLLYRLKVYPIGIPPLRDRRADIPVLVDYYLKHFTDKHKRPIEGVSDEAMVALGMYDWPGNVRELVNVVERAVITCRGPLVTRRHLPFDRKNFEDLPGLSLKDMEKFTITLALRQSHYNKTHAAEKLGTSRKTLIEKVKKYGIVDHGGE